MTATAAASAAYIVAALLFILSLAGLSRHESAKAGNTYGIAGMALALAATVALAVDGGVSARGGVLIAVAVAVGAVGGPGGTQELHGAPGPGDVLAAVHSGKGRAAVVCLDLAHRGQHGPAHAAGVPGRLLVNGEHLGGDVGQGPVGRASGGPGLGLVDPDDGHEEQHEGGAQGGDGSGDGHRRQGQDLPHVTSTATTSQRPSSWRTSVRR